MSTSFEDLQVGQRWQSTGHTGVAEMTIKQTWTGASLRSLAASIEDVFVPLLEKQQDLPDPAFVRCQLDGIPENHAAKALIDNTVWDLNAARLGVPPGQIWGGLCRSSFIYDRSSGARKNGGQSGAYG